MIDYDSFSHCHLTDIVFRYSRGSKRVKEANEPTMVPVVKKAQKFS